MSFRIAGVSKFLLSHRIEVFLAAINLVRDRISVLAPDWSTIRAGDGGSTSTQPLTTPRPVPWLLSLPAVRCYCHLHRRIHLEVCMPWTKLLLSLAQNSDPGRRPFGTSNAPFAGKSGAKHQCRAQWPMHIPASIGFAEDMSLNKGTKKALTNLCCCCLQI